MNGRKHSLDTREHSTSAHLECFVALGGVCGDLVIMNDDFNAIP